MKARHGTTELQVAFACDRLVEREGGNIVRFMRGSRDGVQPLGVPRRRYYVGGMALWWMPRSEVAGLTHETIEFLTREYQHGGIVGAGDARALLAVLRTRVEFGSTRARDRAWAEMTTVALRHPRRAASTSSGSAGSRQP